jgi:chromosomal replication initiation ATPase DnaA
VLKVALPAIRKHQPRPYDPDEERAWLIEIVGFDYRSYVADRVPVDDIQRVVCSFFDLPRASMLTASRQKVIVRPRQIAIYLAKTMTLRSMPDIGQRFGGRDHTTVLHAIRTIEALIKTDREVADVVAYLTEVLKERSCTNQHYPEA